MNDVERTDAEWIALLERKIYENMEKMLTATNSLLLSEYSAKASILCEILEGLSKDLFFPIGVNAKRAQEIADRLGDKVIQAYCKRWDMLEEEFCNLAKTKEQAKQLRTMRGKR